MRYSLEQLQMFALVVETGSFSAAARRLGKTQSTVSMAIANLEIDLGVMLFDRTSRTPTLTEAGRKLLNEAASVLERCLELEAHADSLSEAIEPSLTLAIEVPYTALTAPLAEFAEHFPYVDLDIRHPMHGDVSELMLAGEAVLGVAFSQPGYPRELGFAQLGKLILAHVAHRDHPLAQQAIVRFTDLHSARYLVFRAHQRKLPSSEYLEATRCWQAESYLALLEMTRSGLGWSTLPRRLIERELASDELVELQLEAYPHTDWLVGVDLLWCKTQPLGKAARWLKERLTRHKVYELDRNGHPTTL
ncbi:LysR family transcriptional regulator [Neisseriaceae bacterium JH1-16]|nr:LysR family transcriptional regulator [Neisseriaceae bacterium JH1-16]